MTLMREMEGDGDDVACWTEKNIDFTSFNWVKTFMMKEKKKRVVARPRLEKFQVFQSR